MPVQMVPQVGLDAAAAAVQQLAHAVAGHAADEGHDQQQSDGGLNGREPPAAAERVDAALDEFRAERGEEVGDHDQRHAEEIFAPVGPEVGQEGTQLVHG